MQYEQPRCIDLMSLPAELNPETLEKLLGSIEVNWQEDRLTTLVIPWGMESVETLLKYLDSLCEGRRTYNLKVVLGQNCRQLLAASGGIKVNPVLLDQVGNGTPRDQYRVGDLSQMVWNFINLDFLGLTQIIQDDISILIGGSARTVIPMRSVTLPFSPGEFRFTPENLGWALDRDELLPLWKQSLPRLLLPWDNQQASLIVTEVLNRFAHKSDLEVVSLMGGWATEFRLLYPDTG